MTATSSLPQSHRAAVYSDPGNSLKTEVVEIQTPEPAAGEVLVKLAYSGVCHSDIGFCLNLFQNLPAPTPKGQIGGHEGVGFVVAQGPGVTSPAIGSRVGIKFAADACLTCDYCIEGGESICPSMKVSGYFTPGTFQQYCIASAHYVTPIPEGLDLSAAAPLMCGGVTVYTALKAAGLRPGDWVAICGAGGGLGHLAIQYAKAMNGRVIALDLGSKRELCQSLGADEFLDFTEFPSPEALAAKIREISNGGVRFVQQCSSSSKAYAQAMSWLGLRGTLICLGIPEKEGLLVPDIADMVTRELRIIASKTGNRVDLRECLAIAAKGLVKTHHQIRKMEELTNVFEEMEHGKIQGRAVIDLS